MHGMHFKCLLILNGYFRNNSFQIQNIRDSEIILNRSSRSCYEPYKNVEPDDWKTFYEIWECMYKFRNFLKKIPDKMVSCKSAHGLTESEEMSEHNKERFGCHLKCQFKALGLYKKDENSAFNRAVDKFINFHRFETLDFCREQVNQNFTVKERYSCAYFTEFDECTRGQTGRMLQKLINLLMYTWNYVLDMDFN